MQWQVGGERALAKRLGVRISKLDLWLANIEPVPQSVFLQAVDIVMREDDSFFDGELPPPLQSHGESTDSACND